MLPAAQLLDSSDNTNMANDLSNKVRVTKLQAFADIATRRTRPFSTRKEAPCASSESVASVWISTSSRTPPTYACIRVPIRNARDSGAVRDHAGGSRAAP